MAGQVVECIACGHVGAPQIKGSLWITIILLLIFFPGAIVYEIWRRSGDKVCEDCGNPNIQLYQPNQLTGQIRQRTLNSRVNNRRKKDSKIGLLLVVFVLLAIIAIVFVKPDSDGSSVSQASVAEQKKELQTTPVATSNHQSSQTTSDSSSAPMDFNECKDKALSVQLAVAGTQYKSAVLVDSDVTYIARVCTNDGSVLVTCSAPDQKMITTRSYDCPL